MVASFGKIVFLVLVSKQYCHLNEGICGIDILIDNIKGVHYLRTENKLR